MDLQPISKLEARARNFGVETCCDPRASRRSNLGSSAAGRHGFFFRRHLRLFRWLGALLLFCTCVLGISCWYCCANSCFQALDASGTDFKPSDPFVVLTHVFRLSTPPESSDPPVGIWPNFRSRPSSPNISKIDYPFSQDSIGVLPDYHHRRACACHRCPSSHYCSLPVFF